MTQAVKSLKPHRMANINENCTGLPRRSELSETIHSHMAHLAELLCAGYEG